MEVLYSDGNHKLLLSMALYCPLGRVLKMRLGMQWSSIEHCDHEKYMYLHVGEFSPGLFDYGVML